MNALPELPAHDLAALCGQPVADIEGWVLPLRQAMAAASIDSPARCAAFLAQVIHESDGLRRLEENLAYSAPRLVQVWPRHFYLAPDEPAGRLDAQAYAHNPRTLANLIYANRLGNGDSASGDGWTYRGRGLLQLTGRQHYADAMDVLGMPLLDDPDLLTEPTGATRSAVWYWLAIDGNAMADEDNEEACVRLTRAINGGEIGLDQRLALWRQARAVFAAAE